MDGQTWSRGDREGSDSELWGIGSCGELWLQKEVVNVLGTILEFLCYYIKK